MTQIKKPAPNALRRATALLLAAVAIPATAHAQETVTPPVVVVPTVPAPAPGPVGVPEPQAAPGTSRTTIAPGVVEQAQQEARERAAAARAERPTAAPRSAPVARRGAPAAAAAPVAATAAAPEPVAAAPVTPPQAETAPPAAAPNETATTAGTATEQQPSGSGNTMWLILAAVGAIAAVIAAVKLLRRRREDEVYEEYYEAEPVAAAPVAEPLPVAEPRAPIAPEPIAAAPLFVDRAVAPPRHEPEVHAALEHATLTRPDADDIDAVLGGAAPQGDRPQLELAMRPIRAGVNRDEGVVEFELTVANAGGVEAQDVRIGAFMLSGQPGENAAIERLLVNPPAEAVVEAEAIAPGDGTRVDGAVTLPRGDLHVADDGEGHEGFTPVILADARYRLPDGSEGRTAAAFTVGRVNGGEALVPIALDDDAAMYADIEARLHSVPAKV